MTIQRRKLGILYTVLVSHGSELPHSECWS